MNAGCSGGSSRLGVAEQSGGLGHVPRDLLLGEIPANPLDRRIGGLAQMMFGDGVESLGQSASVG